MSEGRTTSRNIGNAALIIFTVLFIGGAVLEYDRFWSYLLFVPIYAAVCYFLSRKADYDTVTWTIFGALAVHLAGSILLARMTCRSIQSNVGRFAAIFVLSILYLVVHLLVFKAITDAMLR